MGRFAPAPEISETRLINPSNDDRPSDLTPKKFVPRG
jgi:hypothetical protein